MHRASDRKESFSSPSSSSESENSDVEIPWKRRTLEKKAPKSMAVDETPCESQNAFAMAVQKNNLSVTKKRNPIWCAVMQEQGLTEDLQHIGVVNKEDKIYIERSSESYHIDMPPWDQYRNDNAVSTANTKKQEPNLRKRKIDSQGEEVAWKIIKELNEPKHDLIRNIVSVVGKEKAIDLLNKTHDVESAGGMMTINGKRRRTPGGVYIQMLKNDPSITRKQLSCIFQEEKKDQELSRKVQRRIKRQSKPRKVARKLGHMAIEPEFNNDPTSHAVKKSDKDVSNTDDSNTGDSMEIKGSSQQVTLPCNKNDDSELEEGELVD